MSPRELLAGSASGADISQCGRYRYLLSRQWDTRPLLLFVMLNPSVADAHVDDPTIRRCAGFAHSHDFGGFEVVNLFAYRATDPKDLAKAGFPVGPENDRHIISATGRAHTICVAWGAIGTRGSAVDRVQQVMPLLRAGAAPLLLQCLGTTGGGHPRHPLFVAGATRLEPFDAAVEAALDQAHA